MKRTGKIVLALVTVWLLVLGTACAPLPGKGASPAEITPPEKAASSGKVTIPPASEPTPAAEWGIVEIRVTDPPPADVESAVVHLANIELHKVSANESGWIPVVGAPPSFDLMDVIGVTEVLGAANITAGKFTQIRMDVDRVEVVTVDGDNFTAEVPGEKLKIVGAFSVERGGKTTLTLDFDGEKSLIITGKGKALFKPVVKLLIEKEKEKPEDKREPEDKGRPEGKGRPETGEAEGLEFEGSIDAIDGNIWTMTIAGETRKVNVSGAEIEGKPGVTLQAKVKGVVVDGTIIASEVEIEEAKEEKAEK